MLAHEFIITECVFETAVNQFKITDKLTCPAYVCKYSLIFSNS